MMGRGENDQNKLFHYSVDLEDRVRADHPLRRIKELVDFDFIYDEVADTYGQNGNVSVPPPVILKLMLLLVFYNVRSERELMITLPERLDWLWFLGYDLDTEIPNHSVLSKARRRWGVGPFRTFFERIVLQCAEGGLIYGKKIFVDSCLVTANASLNSVINMKLARNKLRKNYNQLSQRLEEKNAEKDVSGSDDSKPSGSSSTGKPTRKGVNRSYLSSTDPDAAITRIGGGKPWLRYKIHRAVDDDTGIITATITTPGDVNEAHRMINLAQQHRVNTGCSPKTVVADSKYGTIDNFLACSSRGMRVHVPDLHRVAKKRESKKRGRQLFSHKMFTFDAKSDSYTCPAGNRLTRKSLHMKRLSIDYASPKSVCDKCSKRDQCTRNKSGRTIKRHLRQDELDRMREIANSIVAKIDLRKRTHFMERSFAEGARHGIKRAKWRGKWKMEIQELLTATIQNIQKLEKHGGSPDGVALIEKISNTHPVKSAQYCFSF